MRALSDQGHQVALLTVDPCTEKAVAGLNLSLRASFASLSHEESDVFLTGLQSRFCSYWGVPLERISQVATLANTWKADAVVAVGLEVLPYLASVKNASRVWYAADEWVLHHYSQVFLRRPSSWKELKPAVIKGLYEHAFSSRVDRVWVVSKQDSRATNWVMRGVHVDIIPNGVDADWYAPIEANEIPKSLVFWGRLDFGPNIDALRYFAPNVWRTLKKRNPDATLQVFGFRPSDEVIQLGRAHSFEVIADREDLRDEIARHQIVVLPFVSGAGIKNKLLEAASMGRAIVASSRAINGVDLPTPSPIASGKDASDWCRTIERLWLDDTERRLLGARSRQWVTQNHSWDSAADKAIHGLWGEH